MCARRRRGAPRGGAGLTEPAPVLSPSRSREEVGPDGATLNADLLYFDRILRPIQIHS
jgi:hypothetical protein